MRDKLRESRIKKSNTKIKKCCGKKPKVRVFVREYNLFRAAFICLECGNASASMLKKQIVVVGGFYEVNDLCQTYNEAIEFWNNSIPGEKQ